MGDSLSNLVLQLGDDIFIVGDGWWDNMWSIKIVMRIFELASRLIVHFVKMNVLGIN